MPITRTCRISWKEFTITDQEIALLEKLSPVIWGEKFLLPLPTLCPEEKLRKKLPFKNYFSLFKVIDITTWETRISSFPPDTPYTVYSQELWWGDHWDPHEYALEYDQKKTVFDHIALVQKSAPFPALDNQYKELINSEYINGNGPSKDCYLTSSSAYNESCLYGWFIFHSSGILDSNYVQSSENCSHSGHIWKCYNVHYAWDASECRDSRYIFSCEWSQYLLGCVWQSNQKYQILNTPCSVEEYESTVAKIHKDTDFRKTFEKKVKNLIETVWVQNSITTGSADSTGDFCYDSKNAYECSNIGDCEDVLYIRDATHVKDSAHISMWWENVDHSYDCIDIWLNSSGIYFSSACWEWARYNFYSTRCQGLLFYILMLLTEAEIILHIQ